MSPSTLLALGFYFGQRDIAINAKGFHAEHFDRAADTIQSQPADFYPAANALRGLSEAITLFAKGVLRPVSILESTAGQ